MELLVLWRIDLATATSLGLELAYRATRYFQWDGWRVALDGLDCLVVVSCPIVDWEAIHLAVAS